MADNLTVPLSRQVSATDSTRPASRASASSTIPILQSPSPPGLQSTTQYGTQSLPHVNGANGANGANGQRPSSLSTRQQPPVVPHDNNLKEWRSTKIKWPYLSIILLITVCFITTIAVLTFFSQRDHGFARESRPPPFLQRNPGLRKAIWEQGIFYTAVPAFIMTIYRTMWDTAVMAFADRQPYVDLMKSGGRSPKRTILLDYKMEFILYRWISAFKNRHFVLSASMLASLVLSFGIVPLTSFLFMMDTTLSNSTLPIALDTYYNGSLKSWVHGSVSIPNLRPVLDTAAGLHMQNLRAPANSDGTLAFPHYTLRAEAGNSNVSTQTVAYGLTGGCIEIPEGQYEKKEQRSSQSVIIEVRTVDRGCPIMGRIDFRADPLFSGTIFTRSWHTSTCSEKSGYTRLSFLAARYDKPSQSIQNFTLLSCKPYYFMTSGTLVQRSESGKHPHLLYYHEDQGNRTEQPSNLIYAMRLYLEWRVNLLTYIDYTDPVDGNEFAKDVYKLAAQADPLEPLSPDPLVKAMGTLFETLYAVFASMYLFEDLVPPQNETAIYMVAEKRLLVVPVAAYIILGVLSVTAILNICLFRSSLEESMLKEEPFSLMSYAGILYKSEVNTTIMAKVVNNEPYDPGMARESAKRLYNLEDKNVTWLYDKATGIIKFKGSLQMQTVDVNGKAVPGPRRVVFSQFTKEKSKRWVRSVMKRLRAVVTSVSTGSRTATLWIVEKGESFWEILKGCYRVTKREIVRLVNFRK
ncbi:hypothetical protein P154DRAFT_567385 [Amniculicola lignicola CBS 123094]|uniref:Uncharacterized protein n=1 Tax=Amniculicola lignicola CBS 123094 TaxID=1392246 RepID=A0A6A5VZE9_9PLEO|nr:hypothetical protein P154DRAFT_567385 [Amniculicola lignicola CBS 123094]